MKSLLRLIWILGTLAPLFLSIPAISHNGMDVEEPALKFPWGDAQIQRVRCLMAKDCMVMLVLEFDSDLKPEVFDKRNYALVKWIDNNPIEVTLNERLNGTSGVLPAFGFNVNNFTLATLLPWPKQNLEALAKSINTIGKPLGKREKIVDINTLTLCKKRKDNTTLIVMPFKSLMDLKEFISIFGAKDNLVPQIEEKLKPTFDKMLAKNIVHGDLALRNIGVILDPSDPLVDYDSAFKAIQDIVLYDFGSDKAKFLSPKQHMEYRDTLDYVLDLVKLEIAKPARRQPRVKVLPNPTPEILAQLNANGEPSPIKLMKDRKRIGPPHAYHNDINLTEPARKKTCARALDLDTKG